MKYYDPKNHPKKELISIFSKKKKDSKINNLLLYLQIRTKMYIYFSESNKKKG